MTESDMDREELRRVLRMVEDGKLSGAEADRLLDRLHPDPQQTCPWCAEAIPAAAAVCPACASRLDVGASRGVTPALGGLSKGLIVYLFAVTGIVLLSGLFGIGSMAALTQMCLAGLGLTAAVCMCRHLAVGWVLGTLWAAAQIVAVAAGGGWLNRQVLYLGINFVSGGSGLGLNLVGVILLVLFLKARRADSTEGC